MRDKFRADLVIDSEVQVKLGQQEYDLDSTRSIVSNSLQTWAARSVLQLFSGEIDE